MEGLRAFKAYMALKLHFTSPSYDYHKYLGKCRSATDKAFTNRKDAHFFRRLERKYSQDELINFFVANFVAGDGVAWIGNLTSISAEKIFAEWKRNRESATYIFTEDLKFLKDFEPDAQRLFEVPAGGSHPQLLKFLLGKKIKIETVIACNRVLGFIDKWNDLIEDRIIWTDAARIISKYDPFLTFDTREIKVIMRKELL